MERFRLQRAIDEPGLLLGNLGFRVLGLRVMGLGFRVLGFRVLGFRVMGLGFKLLYWGNHIHYDIFPI